MTDEEARIRSYLEAQGAKLSPAAIIEKVRAAMAELRAGAESVPPARFYDRPAPEERRAAHRARMVGGARARPRGSLRACPAGRSDGTARPEDRARDVRH